MIALPQIPPKLRLLGAGLLLVGLLVSFQNLAYYVRINLAFSLMMMCLPVVCRVVKPGEYSWRYGILSLLMLAAYPYLKIQSCFFMGFGFFVLFVIESTWGKLNYLPVVLMAAASPTFSFFSRVFSFPIRLKISSWVTGFLSPIMPGIEASGNLIALQGQTFSVEDACVGLKLITTSIIALLILIAFRERATKQVASVLQLVVLFAITFGLVVLANILRVATLIVFQSRPDTFSHELIGISALVMYIVLPLWFIVKWVIRKKHPTEPDGTLPQNGFPKLRLVGVALLLVGLGLLNLNREQFRNQIADTAVEQMELDGFESEFSKFGVTKLENEDALIYVKSSSTFYGADHTPMICWRGSGYSFKHERVLEVNGQGVLTAELHHENGDVLHTAWWYDNGYHQTIEQFDWRWRMVRGQEAFRIVNVSCLDEETLIQQVGQLLDQSPLLEDLKPIIQNT